MQSKVEQASRHLQRLWAVQILYQMEAAEENSNVAWKKFSERVPELDRQEFCKELVRGVEEEIDILDQALKEKVDSWDPERMGMVERNILRLALWELRNEDLPYQVIVDEAIELAKEFAGDKAGRFVNGVLARFLSSDES